MRRTALVSSSLLLVVILFSCSKNQPEGTASELTGAGSTFVYPLMSKWAAEYTRSNPSLRINYQSIGSGGGIRQVSEGTVDFGATDGPMSDEQLASSRVGPILHIPVVMGADVCAYNLPGLSVELKFAPAVLAGIFLGKITNWNDPEIAKSNSGAKLPNQHILVAHRSDGSGTTYIWTDYLSKVSPEWKSKVGTNTSVNWPVGLGAKGNEGLAGVIRQTPGAIGYVELIYAEQNNIPFGSVQNSAGAFVKPSMESVTAAAASAQIPDDFRYSITNAPGGNAYPVSGTVWLLFPIHPHDSKRGKLVVDFASWILNQGQTLAPTLHYAQMPSAIITRAKQSLEQVK